jgi:hypothetical protein
VFYCIIFACLRSSLIRAVDGSHQLVVLGAVVYFWPVSPISKALLDKIHPGMTRQDVADESNGDVRPLLTRSGRAFFLRRDGKLDK